MQHNQREKVRTLFDDWAERGRAEGMERGHAFSARQAFERLQLSPGHTYLDIGCGNGYSVRWAAGVDPTVTAVGLDISPKMVERARTLSSEWQNTRFIQANFPVPELKAHAFDAIFSMEVFYYFPDLVWAVQNVARLLKPGGLFVCTMDYYRENEASHGWPEDTGVEMHLLSEAEWRRLMEEIGLEVVEQTRLKAPLEEGEEPDWKHTAGSLMTLVRRPPEPTHDP